MRPAMRTVRSERGSTHSPPDRRKTEALLPAPAADKFGDLTKNLAKGLFGALEKGAAAAKEKLDDGEK